MRIMLIIAMLVCCNIVATAEETTDKGMKVPDLKIGMKMTNKGVEARAGVDLFDFFGTKTKATDIPLATGGGSDAGVMKSLGSWVSANPWKSALIFSFAVWGGYELYDSNKSSGGKDKAVAGQGGTASSQIIDLSNNAGTINFNYTGDDSAGQSGRDTVPFVEE